MKALWLRLVREEEGQDLIEYALICTLVALVVYLGSQALGTALNNWYDTVATNVDAQSGSAS